MKENRLNILTNYLNNSNIDGFMLPSNDAFQSEYVPAHARRLEWLTGFTGSNGSAIILADGRAAFFTDGRYTIQAQKEVPDIFERFDLAQKKPAEWLAEHAKGKTIAYDPWLYTETGLKSFKEHKVSLKTVSINPIDAIWEDKSEPTAHPISLHPLEFSGATHQEKLENIKQFITDKEADAFLLTAPDSICWLLNIRGKDVPCTPLVLAYAIMHKNGDLALFTESAKAGQEVKKALGKSVSFYSCSNLEIKIKSLNNKKILIDDTNAPLWFKHHLPEAEFIAITDPFQLAKAIKNQTEMEGSRQAHIKDGAAIVKALYWIKTSLEAEKEVSECDIADRLMTLRSEQQHFQEPSFGTIAGFNANGAIVHYQPKKESCATLDNKNGSMLLLDSGGQYLDGTTDITRTIALGTPTDEQKKHFTLVLKGHIALATAIFPVGTTGSALDVLARNHLWQDGLDYAHGTGHGVGSYLGVHEGPQRISKLPSNVALKPGMILSNEPGFYKTGEYGIRIENLVLVIEHPEHKGFLTFETLTKAPIDLNLVDRHLLSRMENLWLDHYHNDVFEKVNPFLNKQESQWLQQSIQR